MNPSTSFDNKNLFLQAVKANISWNGFENDVRSSLKYSYSFKNQGTIFQTFSRLHEQKNSQDGILKKKFNAICGVGSSLISTISQLFLMIFRLNRFGLYCVGRHAEKVAGNLISLFSEKQGNYWINCADFHLQCYQYHLNAPKHPLINETTPNPQTYLNHHKPVIHLEPHNNKTKAQNNNKVNENVDPFGLELSEEDKQELSEKQKLFQEIMDEHQQVLKQDQQILEITKNFLNSSYTQEAFIEQGTQLKDSLKNGESHFTRLPNRDLKILTDVKGKGHKLLDETSEFFIKAAESDQQTRTQLSKLGFEKTQLYLAVDVMLAYANCPKEDTKKQQRIIVLINGLFKALPEKDHNIINNFCSIFKIQLQK